MQKDVVRKIHRRLSTAYGPEKSFAHPKGRPLDVLVQTILSQNTSDTNSTRAYKSLRDKYPRWSQVVEAPEESIARCIRSGGLAEMKSVRIKQVLQTIKEREQRLSLSRLDDMDTDGALEYLSSLPGVGMKTASCVLLFGMGRPVMPVDTHVFRITRRIGWINGNTTIDEAGLVLKRAIPDANVLSLHLYLIEHGRATRKARNPRCQDCPLASLCKSCGNGDLG